MSQRFKAQRVLAPDLARLDREAPPKPHSYQAEPAFTQWSVQRHSVHLPALRPLRRESDRRALLSSSPLAIVVRTGLFAMP